MYLSPEQFVGLILLVCGLSFGFTAFFVFLIYRNRQAISKMNIEIRDVMLRTQDQEQERIARDLHDDLGSLLSGIKLQIASVQPLNQEEHSTLLNVSRNLNRAIGNIRQISRNLSSTCVNRGGLISSIEQLIGQFKSQTAIVINFEHNVTSDLPERVTVNLYRLAVELLNNSIKHSNGDAIRISIKESDSILIFHFSDNGNSPGTPGNGLGLTSVLNRVKLLKGEIAEATPTFENGAKFRFEFSIRNLMLHG